MWNYQHHFTTGPHSNSNPILRIWEKLFKIASFISSWNTTDEIVKVSPPFKTIDRTSHCQSHCVQKAFSWQLEEVNHLIDFNSIWIFNWSIFWSSIDSFLSSNGTQQMFLHTTIRLKMCVATFIQLPNGLGNFGSVYTGMIHHLFIHFISLILIHFFGRLKWHTIWIKVERFIWIVETKIIFIRCMPLADKQTAHCLCVFCYF